MPSRSDTRYIECIDKDQLRQFLTHLVALVREIVKIIESSEKERKEQGGKNELGGENERGAFQIDIALQIDSPPKI
jgi:hypothetical protein